MRTEYLLMFTIGGCLASPNFGHCIRGGFFFAMENEMKFILIMEQDGEGCDYTIGCGKQFETIEADTVEEAKAKVPEILDYYGCLSCDEKELEKLILTSNPIELPYEEWLQARQDKEAAEEQRAVDAKEKAEYERLKAKHG